MSLLSSISRWLGVFVLGVAMAAAVHAQGNLEIDTPAIAALKQSMQKRHAQLEPLYTAGAVGQRYGQLVMLSIDAKRMRADGHLFYCSDNGVWLTDTVPPAYLTVMQ